MEDRYLEQGWRWYGPQDTVTLADIRQAGATTVVTALHHIKHGEVWPMEDIIARKELITAAGLTWSVVESVPVHEAIKTGSIDAAHYLENYRQSLRNLAKAGIKTICYNFMPVLDWTRTQLDLVMEDGSKALNFEWLDLAIFDLFILKRKDAEKSYTAAIVEKAGSKFAGFTDKDCQLLAQNILMGIPGESDASLADLRESIAIYQKIGAAGLRDNLAYFLSSIATVCEEEGIKMSIHPDDPPYPILGLPRIASCLADLQDIMKRVDKAFNGICFCTGSLGAGPENDVPAMFAALKSRVYFVHLRNVKRNSIGDFYEADHLSGDVDMFAVMKALVAENQTRELAIPFRPDHGHQMLDDLKKDTFPGYSAIGRLRGLAELRGLELGIIKSSS